MIIDWKICDSWKPINYYSSYFEHLSLGTWQSSLVVGCLRLGPCALHAELFGWLFYLVCFSYQRQLGIPEIFAMQSKAALNQALQQYEARLGTLLLISLLLIETNHSNKHAQIYFTFSLIKSNMISLINYNEYMKWSLNLHRLSLYI